MPMTDTNAHHERKHVCSKTQASNQTHAPMALTIETLSAAYAESPRERRALCAALFTCTHQPAFESLNLALSTTMTATVACASVVNKAAAAGRCLVRNAATAGCRSDQEARSRAPRMSNRDGSLTDVGAGLRAEAEELPKLADVLDLSTIVGIEAERREGPLERANSKPSGREGPLCAAPNAACMA